MKSIIKIMNMDSQDDTKRIKEAITYNTGVIASQASISKKEITIIYDEASLTLEKLIETIEDLGYLVI